MEETKETLARIEAKLERLGNAIEFIERIAENSKDMEKPTIIDIARLAREMMT